ncbi:MAG TPA: NADH-quinone oxidoreductase subunit C [Acidimicrobiia bacterium]|nr:NADH-quinone oxidoreductase subunit C [Acidimicrobiia bacterium]
MVQRVADAVPGSQLEESFGQAQVRVPTERLAEAATAARDAGFLMFVDLCAVDYLHRAPRFEVVTVLLSLDPPVRLRLVTGADAEEPVVPSLTSVYPGANFYEREAYDLFGVRFEGHPELTRILLPDDWEGHPLRKDTPVGAVPVQFKDAREVT